MNVFNRLFSMLAAVIVSALLPFSMSAESESSPHHNLYGSSNLSASVSDDRRQDDLV
ncbi:hypothetical protein QO259_16445 [Salinicola sp. JS01]|uniref:hypothetical protein n=1 Tax=Salinicola sp. JS01 TaxID=3050071 RepID=UPI00255B5E49|nr:hypothetical protein [Salinicola sp. JS01]WIX32379.1 hypothetical protein QO259_16445 [Salinicola sp. JS01]